VGAIQPVYAQLTNCPGTPGNGVAEFGNGGFANPNILNDACGVIAVGFYALTNDIASLNSAVGLNSLTNNTTGSGNSAIGADTLVFNTTGSNMTAVGYQALYSNTTGSGNNAQGYQAMYSNTTGSNNSAIGAGALYASTTGIGNSAVGLTALENMTAGNRNTAVGNNAGLNLLSGYYNTYIGWGVNGSSGVTATSENYVTRIGVTYPDPNVHGSSTTYIAGISNSPVTGVPVYVSASGQLGFSGSSERLKSDIAPLGGRTEKLSLLRPVSFHVKTDPNGATQYGLIAEEVDKVYPELVIRDKDGRIAGVRYDELAPMLLNEVQKQQQKMAAQDAVIASLVAQREAEAALRTTQAARIDSLEQQMAAQRLR
jgi:hypothetical protein